MDACVVCDRPMVFSWTDTHGVAQCACGTPYQIIHREGEGEQRRVVDKPPSCAVKEHWIPLLRRFRSETGCTIYGGYSFPGGWELAKEDDQEAFSKWCEANKAEIDAAGQMSALLRGLGDDFQRDGHQECFRKLSETIDDIDRVAEKLFAAEPDNGQARQPGDVSQADR